MAIIISQGTVFDSFPFVWLASHRKPFLFLQDYFMSAGYAVARFRDGIVSTAVVLRTMY